jgi:hypothetical protein
MPRRGVWYILALALRSSWKAVIQTTRFRLYAAGLKT